MQKEILKNSFHKNKLIKFLLIDQILSGKIKNTLISDIIADEYNVNLNTVKKAFNELRDNGYLYIKKKSGTKVKEIPIHKIENYSKIKFKIKNILNTGENLGLTPEELFSCFVSSFNEYKKFDEEQKIIFVEKDYHNLWIGKTELEEILKTNIIPLLVDDALNYIDKILDDNTIIVTTYYCQQLLNDKNLKVFPLKITPPLEQLINFNTIPEDAYIVILTISEELKNRLKSTYHFLQKKFKNLKFFTIKEVLLNKSILKNVDILLTLKSIYNDYSHLFKEIKKVVVYSRFHDEEGIKLLKKLIKEKD